MKKSLIALAVLAAAGAASAQSSVTLSGGVAVGFQHDGTAATAVNKISNLGAADSNVTMTAVEDLGGGLKATAIINQRFNADNGESSATDKRFAQNVKLALSSATLGEVAAGRFNLPVDAMRAKYDPFNAAGATAFVFGHPSDAATRYNGTLQYTSPVFSGVKVALATVMKSNTTGYVGGVTEGAVSYDNGPLSLGAGYTRNETAAEEKKVVTLGGAYNFGVVKLSATHSDVNHDAATADYKRSSLGLSAPIGSNIVLKAGYERKAVDGGANVNGTAVGVDYLLSKRTKFIGDLAKKTGDNEVSLYAGVKHVF